MEVRPILFNTEMVRAILDGRKTQTRRLVKPSHKWAAGFNVCFSKSSGKFSGVYDFDDEESMYDDRTPAPYQPGDVLWVRETWCRIGNPKAGRPMHYCYRADMDDPSKDDMGFIAYWRPSIHMPREAARLFLRVKDVRIQRLQDMSAQDSIDEGVKLDLKGIIDGENPLMPFAEEWNRTIGDKKDFSKYCWSANPWVWVIEFERCSL